MRSRRSLLRTAAGSLSLTVAGCSGSNSSNGIDCTTSAVAHGDGDLLGGVTAVNDDDTVRLWIPIDVNEARETGLDRVRVLDSTGDLRYEIPVDPGAKDIAPAKQGVSGGVMRYEQTLGPRPQHGRYRVVAVDTEGGELDSLVVDFNCFAEG